MGAQRKLPTAPKQSTAAPALCPAHPCDPCPLSVHTTTHPAPLFALITQLLPLPDKLLHLTHVCRTFPALTPWPFACDTLAWTRQLLLQLSILPLLSLIPCALYVDHPKFTLDCLCDLLDPDCPPSFLPVLRAVTLAPVHDEGMGGSPASSSAPTPPPCIWVSSTQCPQTPPLSCLRCRSFTASVLSVSQLSASRPIISSSSSPPL